MQFQIVSSSDRAFWHRSGVVVAMAAGGILAVCGSSALAADPLVANVTDAVGLGAPHASVETGFGTEFMTSGGACGDFDNDGDLDLFIVGGSAASDHLYINDGTGHFTDEAAAWGVDRVHMGSGAAVGDFNNDGWLDLMVTSLGLPNDESPDHNVLYMNNGDGSFSDVTDAAGLGGGFNPFGLADTFSPAFGDYDLDGDLDLAIAGWYGGNKLFRNNGDGTFTDATGDLNADMTIVRGFAPRFVDMDGDRYPELLWVADFYTSRYFVNNGDGTFTDQTASSGTGLDSNGMGNTFGDYDGDGRLDWYVSSRINHQQTAGSGNMLYLASGIDHVYDELSVERNCNFGYWGWGVVSVDINHDGHLDIFETNGFDGIFLNDPSILYLNDGTGHFVDEAPACGMDITSSGRGVLDADFDTDGDQDIVVFNARQEPIYFRNDIAGPGTNAVTLFLDTSAVDDLAPNGFGTRVWFDSDSFSQVRYLDGGSNYLSQSELSVHAGLGADESVDITIEWANGQVDEYPGVVPGRYTIKALDCGGDLTGDGAINFFDLSQFLTHFNNEHPQGDISADGRYNFFDISAYLQLFNAGCP
ncbi:MAG: CRTAC1 family protein [Phycisphaerales bacterium]